MRYVLIEDHDEFICNDEASLSTPLNPYKLWVMDLELLQSISLAVSQTRTVETVLKMIVAGLVDNAGVALARIWLLGPGDICSTCRMSSECSDRTRCLHLAATAGRSLV